MTVDFLKQLEILFEEKKINPEIQKDLFLLFSKMETVEQEKLWSFLNKNPDWILKLENNILSKKDIWNTQDSKKWNKLVEEEYTDLLRIEIADM
ncbi:MAG: hypothetical protein WA057_00935 [Candidatus Magasanikiibacteriota bacterium]